MRLYCWRRIGLTLGAIATGLSTMVMDAAGAIATPTPDLATRPAQPSEASYWEVIQRTVGMLSDPQANALVSQFGLDILDITWEDTGRFYDSAVGPNISDMTIQVQYQEPGSDRYHLSLMPVIRHPNFADLSADIPIDQFYLLVGNERGEELRRVSLRELLGNLRQYLSEPDSWAGEGTSLLADRDTHVLVSAQACFLPVPQGGIAQFNPVLFNYQSQPDDPAVLTILATREGTSVTIIDNWRDAFEAGPTWGQRLFFNQNGNRASFTGQRISDFRVETGGEGIGTETVEVADEAGLNMVLLIQVPLIQRYPNNFGYGGYGGIMPAAPLMESTDRVGSNVEEAVIGHGEIEGPFTEIDGVPIERDPRFPIRVTVQFYQATSNGVISEADVRRINDQIARVYEDADYVGSLVVDGPSRRPTEHQGPHLQPDGWWEDFWQSYEGSSGMSREEVLELLRWLRGEGDRPEI